jgi:hypothetical protein
MSVDHMRRLRVLLPASASDAAGEGDAAGAGDGGGGGGGGGSTGTGAILFGGDVKSAGERVRLSVPFQRGLRLMLERSFNVGGEDDGGGGANDLGGRVPPRRTLDAYAKVGPALPHCARHLIGCHLTQEIMRVYDVAGKSFCLYGKGRWEALLLTLTGASDAFSLGSGGGGGGGGGAGGLDGGAFCTHPPSRGTHTLAPLGTNQDHGQWFGDNRTATPAVTAGR